MKGLDKYLEGVYNPNAPCNQDDYDWAEYFSNVLDYCIWLDNDNLLITKTYRELGILMTDAAYEALSIEDGMSGLKPIEGNEGLITNLFSAKVSEKINEGKAKWVYVLKNKVISESHDSSFITYSDCRKNHLSRNINDAKFFNNTKTAYNAILTNKFKRIHVMAGEHHLVHDVIKVLIFI